VWLWWPLLLAALLAGQCATGPVAEGPVTAVPAAPLNEANPPAARINGLEFSLAELERELAFNRATYKLTNERELVLQDLAGALQDLIPSLVLNQHALEAGVVVSEAETSARLESYLASRNSTVEDLEWELKPYGYTAAEVRGIFTRMVRLEKYIDQVMAEPGPHQEDFSGWLDELLEQAEIEILYEPPQVSPLQGSAAPDFTAPTLSGAQASLARFRGQPVILNFWATWCGPCREEMPLFQQLYEARRESGLVVLAVNFEEEPALIRPYVDGLALTFDILLDPEAALAKQYRVTGLPTTFFIDRHGLIQHVQLGPVTEELLAEQISQW
jgi:cytochrome c biogenesis protein CcmG/thiol:disulfide interchange protein DsbE